MKYLSILVVCLILSSCGTKVPITNQLKEEYNLNETNMKKVQFYTSQIIYLERSKSTGSQGTASDGSLVTSKNTEQDRIIIPAGTTCIFDSYGPNGEVIVRFQSGTLKFGQRANQTNGKYYLYADWQQDKGGELKYGKETFYATTDSGSAYLMVVLKKLNKNKRKDKVEKGMRI